MRTKSAIISILVLAIIISVAIFFFNINNRSTFPSAKVIHTDIENAVQQCEKAKISEQDECYLVLASKSFSFVSLNKSMSICEKIGDINTKKFCYSQIYNYEKTNASTDMMILWDMCKKSETEDCKNYILFTFMPQIIKEKPEDVFEFCKLIDSDKEFCFQQVSQFLAYKDMNKAIEACSLIDFENDRLICYNQILLNIPERVNKYPDESISVCKTFSLNVDSCFENIAYTLRDNQPVKAVSVCKLIRDSFREEGCYNTIWLNVPSYVQSNPELSIEICGRYKSSNAGCYQSIAKSLSETSKSWARRACEEIEDEGGRNWCLEMYS